MSAFSFLIRRLTSTVRPWLGSGALITLAVAVIGRLALEPMRSRGQFDAHGMEAFEAVEAFKLRKPRVHPRIAFFGSSQTMWGIHSPTIADTLGTTPESVHNLGTPGGSAFDMWNLVRRNPKSFRNLKMAVLEVSPWLLKTSLENDPRLSLSISQHATLGERQLLNDPRRRWTEIAEWFVPLKSVRRSLRSSVLDVVDPDPGHPIFPTPDRRIHLPDDWDPAVDTTGSLTPRQQVTVADAAKRLLHRWKLSKLHDSSLRKLMAWMNSRRIPMVLHQVPVSPEVAQLIRTEPRYLNTYTEFGAYYDSLQPPPAAIDRILGLDEIGVGNEGMADRTHLNKIGAVAYSSHLAGTLRPISVAKVSRHRSSSSSARHRREIAAGEPRTAGTAIGFRAGRVTAPAAPRRHR